MDIPAALKQWRAQQGYSQAAAARAAGESPRTWQEWEQGRRAPSGRALERLWAVLKLHDTAVPQTGQSFAARLRIYRKQTGQNRAEAAKALGVSAGMIQDCEQERRVPRGATIVRLLPIFQSAEAKWKEDQARPLSPEMQLVVQRMKQRDRRRPKPRPKRVFATVQERVKFCVANLKRGKAACAALQPWERPRMAKALARAELELRRAEAAASEAKCTAKREKKRIAKRRPRRASPVF